MNEVLLSPTERAAGKELKTARDIARHEEKLGVYRAEAHVQRIQLEEQAHDAALIASAVDSGGIEGGYDYVDTTEIMSSTGWDKATTERWKESTSATERDIANGVCDPTTFGRNPYQRPDAHDDAYAPNG